MSFKGRENIHFELGSDWVISWINITAVSTRPRACRHVKKKREFQRRGPGSVGGGARYLGVFLFLLPPLLVGRSPSLLHLVDVVVEVFAANGSSAKVLASTILYTTVNSAAASESTGQGWGRGRGRAEGEELGGAFDFTLYVSAP